MQTLRTQPHSARLSRFFSFHFSFFRRGAGKAAFARLIYVTRCPGRSPAKPAGVALPFNRSFRFLAVIWAQANTRASPPQPAASSRGPSAKRGRTGSTGFVVAAAAAAASFSSLLLPPLSIIPRWLSPVIPSANSGSQRVLETKAPHRQPRSPRRRRTLSFSSSTPVSVALVSLCRCACCRPDAAVSVCRRRRRAGSIVG